uniref:Uncharacterized protein n=1 Tax=Caenorhabditis japonica TaxID=281687 RepID=A0A8R1IK31_CAEJA
MDNFRPDQNHPTTCHSLFVSIQLESAGGLSFWCIAVIAVWSGPRSISHRQNATECTTSTITPRPHMAKTTKSPLAPFSWTIHAHSPYSPGLAPTDYHLVPDLQRFLEENDFKQNVMSKIGLCHILHQKSQFWRTGTMSLQNRWQTVVDKEGKYY